MLVHKAISMRCLPATADDTPPSASREYLSESLNTFNAEYADICRTYTAEFWTWNVNINYDIY
jgi:hypothetical protein